MIKDMTTGSPLKCILRFCIPLLIGNLFQQFYNLADSILVGRILGLNAFAGVGVTGALNFLIIGFALGVCSGLSIPISQSFGAGRTDLVRKRTAQLVWLGFGISVLIQIVCFFWTDDLLRLMNTPKEIFDDAYRYIFLIFMGVGATMLYNLSSAVLRALGDSRTPLHFLVGAVAINVFLDILFMKYLHTGVEGAAWATILSQLASGIACVLYILRKIPFMNIRRSDLRPDWRIMRLMLRIGVPMGAQFAITAVGSIIMQSAVNGLGATAVAAVSAAAKVHNIVAAPLESCGIAMATYCGQNLGAGRIDRIRRGVLDTTVVSMLYCVAAFLFNYTAGQKVALLFVDASEIRVLRLAQQYLVAMSAFYPTLAVIFIFRNGLQGMGYSGLATLAGVCEMIGRTAAALLLIPRIGYPGACWASPIAWILADAFLLPAYFHVRRKTYAAFGQSRNCP